MTNYFKLEKNAFFLYTYQQFQSQKFYFFFLEWLKNIWNDVGGKQVVFWGWVCAFKRLSLIKSQLSTQMCDLGQGLRVCLALWIKQELYNNHFRDILRVELIL